MSATIDNTAIDAALDRMEMDGDPNIHLYISVYDPTLDIENMGFRGLVVMNRQDDNILECLATRQTIEDLRKYRGDEICTVKATLW